METLPQEFLLGIELFNDGKFFECHEVWETIWLKAEGIEREFLLAMIQVAAALLHIQRGNFSGAQSVGRRAIGKLKNLPERLMNIDTQEIRLSLETCLAAANPSFPRIEFQNRLRNGNP